MTFIWNLIVVIIAAWLLPGITISGFIAAFCITIAIALINTFASPFIVLLTLPLTAITLGLFLFFIDVITIYIAAAVIPGFYVAGFWSALFFGLIISIFGTILD